MWFFLTWVVLSFFIVSPPVKFSHKFVEIEGVRFKLYIADSPLKWIKGFQGRQVKENEAMLFEFPSSKERGFWMFGVWSPLDIVFLNDEFQAIRIFENAKPWDVRQKKAEGKYVLELRGGLARKLNIVEGKKIAI